MLTIYNLSPWLCAKHTCLMMSSLISSPKQQKNDIDVYLEALIEDLKIMWEEGKEVFNSCHQEFFTLQAILLWTSMIFFACGNLSKYNVEGYEACFIYEEDTFSLQLKYERKTIYLGIQRFLPTLYHYRRL